jgi:RNA polymerase sigma-70 factor (ECF subfamily)
MHPAPSQSEISPLPYDRLAVDEVFSRVLEDAGAGLRGYVRGQLSSADAADDAVQETFLRMLRYRDVKDAGEIRALLFRVAANVVADNYRHAKARRTDAHCPLDSLQLASSAPAPERVFSARQDLAVIKQAIGNLPPRCRQVFLLHRFEGLSYREIAQRLGISSRTVENQIAHALTVCRRAIGENRGRTFKQT